MNEPKTPTPIVSSALLASRYPNNKPKLVTENQLFERGMAVECRGPQSPFGYTPVVCVNILGIHETHMLANAPGERPAGSALATTPKTL